MFEGERRRGDLDMDGNGKRIVSESFDGRD